MNELYQQLQAIRKCWVKGRPDQEEACAVIRHEFRDGCYSYRQLSELATSALYDVVSEQYPRQVPVRKPDYLRQATWLATFNDSSVTTQAQIERLVEKAAVRLDEIID